MFYMWAAIAVAAPPPEPEVEIVRESYEEGPVKLTFPGREGDEVSVDGWRLGKLPVETSLLQGIHTFDVKGKAGPFSITTNLQFSETKPLALDLSKAEPADVEVPARIEIIGDSSRSSRDAAQSGRKKDAKPETKTPSVSTTP